MSTSLYSLLVGSDTLSSAYVPPVRNISWVTTTLSNNTVIQGGTLAADAVMEERSDDESVITENPVEIGSVTNDHAYDLPQELGLSYIWAPATQDGTPNTRSQSFLVDTYNQLLTLKQAKVLVSVVTGKRQYQNMLIKGLSLTTDAKTENILSIRISMRQLLLVQTTTGTVASSSQQSLPERTTTTTNSGTLQPVASSNFNTTSTSSN